MIDVWAARLQSLWKCFVRIRNHVRNIINKKKVIFSLGKAKSSLFRKRFVRKPDNIFKDLCLVRTQISETASKMSPYLNLSFIIIKYILFVFNVSFYNKISIKTEKKTSLILTIIKTWYIYAKTLFFHLSFYSGIIFHGFVSCGNQYTIKFCKKQTWNSGKAQNEKGTCGHTATGSAKLRWTCWCDAWHYGL